MRLRSDHDDGSATMAAALSLAALVFTLIAALVLNAGCGHNPGSYMFGEQARLGFGEYGSYNSVKGMLLTDVPRENTCLEIEVDSEHGIQYDPATGALKGLAKIRRTVGAQITGYLVDLAEACPEAAVEYLRKQTNADICGKTQDNADKANAMAEENLALKEENSILMEELRAHGARLDAIEEALTAPEGGAR